MSHSISAVFPCCTVLSGIETHRTDSLPQVVTKTGLGGQMRRRFQYDFELDLLDAPTLEPTTIAPREKIGAYCAEVRTTWLTCTTLARNNLSR